MKFRRSLLIVTCLIFWNVSFAQDLITLTSGDDIKVKVLEVNVDLIKYKKHDNPDGPSYTIPRSDVFVIRYENGTKDIINPLVKEAPVEVKNKNPVSKEPVYKNQISFSAGFSKPIGAFATGAWPLGTAGAGANMHFFFGRKFTKNFGLGFKWLGNSNSLVEATDAFWGSGGLLTGITLHAPASAMVVFDFRVLGGYMWLIFPELVDNSGNTRVNQAIAGSFGYSFGTGASVFLTPRINLKFSVDYLGSNFVFSEIKSYGFVLRNVKQPYGVINSTIGLGINFGK